MNAKMDTASLIYSAKTGIIDLLLRLFDKIVITEEVAKEATRKRGRPDADLIYKYIKEGKIKIVKSKLIASYSLGLGERSIIGLAANEPKSEYLLFLDDRKARAFSAALGIDAVPIYAALFIALKRKIISLSSAIVMLENLNQFARYPGDKIAEIKAIFRLIERGEL